MSTAKTIVIAAAVNDFYVNPLLVTLHSAARHLSAGWTLEVFAFGYDVTPESKQRLQAGLDGLPVRVQWRTIDLRAVRDYWPGIRRDSEITAYYRLFLGEALPETVDRVLFLDADLLIDGDLSQLWRLPFDGHVVQAVPDAYASRLHTPRLSRISFSEGVRFSRDTPYFNAGVQLIDLRRWREENTGKRAVAFVWKYAEHLDGRDQDALNCALAGRWKRLSPTWNFQELPDHLDVWEAGGASPDEIHEAFHSPAITHFIGWKPWSRKWRPLAERRWWTEARLAGVPEVSRPFHIRLWEALLSGPNNRLRWFYCRGQRNRIPLYVLAHPWTLLTYPLWRAICRYT